MLPTIAAMLDLSVRNLSFSYPEFALRGVSLTFPASTHTALVGPAGCGVSTLLRIVAGELRPAAGEIRIGSRVVNDLKAVRRPLLFAASSIDAPGRWSVRHLLIAAARQRTLDREDRQREVELAAAKWTLGALLDRRIDTLSSTESVRANLARIEVLKPGILLADRVLETLNISELAAIVDEWYRTLRVMGTTVIAAPSSSIEAGASDRVIIVVGGRVVQQGVPSAIYGEPENEAAAMAMGGVNILPITIRGNAVESVIGSWQVENAPFQGGGVALVRPGDFTLAGTGEESDLIFGVEEATFYDGRWHVRGLLSDAFMLRVTLPGSIAIHKGKLMGLRFDATRFTLLPK